MPAHQAVCYHHLGDSITYIAITSKKYGHSTLFGTIPWDKFIPPVSNIEGLLTFLS